MSKRAEKAALKAYPEDWEAGYFDDPDEVTDDNEEAREYFQQGYEQAEKDLALTLAQVVKLDNIIMNMVGEGYNDGYKTRPFYDEVLKRFNEQRKK